MKWFVCLTFFLLIFTALPVHAYLDIDINASSGDSGFGIACSNLTGTMYCYGLYQGGDGADIARWNETLGDRKYCDTGCVGACAWTYTRGIDIVNSTHIRIQRSTGNYLVDVSNMTASTECTSSSQLGNHLNDTGSPDLVECGYTDGFIMCGLNNGVRNATTNAWIHAGYWDTSTILAMSIPNASDNTTTYGLRTDGVIVKYVGEAVSSIFGDINNTWGIEPMVTPVHQYNWDTFDDGNTTWAYIRGKNDRIYRVNLTEADVLGQAYIVAIHPTANETVGDTTPELHARVYNNNTGTIGWFVDGVYQANVTFTASGDNTTEVYYTTDELTPNAVHNWTAVFYPTGGSLFSTATESFVTGFVSIAENPIQGTAGYFGSLFGVTEQDDANNIFALLCCLIGSVGITIGISNVARGGMAGNSLVIMFMGSFMALMLMFTIAGMLNAFYTTILIVISALGLWSLLGRGIGG